MGQHASNGPLTYEEGSPLQRISYTAPMEDAVLVGDGVVVMGIALGFSNIFEQDSAATHMLFIDMERLVTSFGIRWGLTERVELGGRLLFETTGAGALDGAILAWHEFFGFGQANRDRFPEGQYRQLLTDGNGTVFFDEPRRRMGFEDARLFAKVRVSSWDDGRGVLSVRAGARLPGSGNRTVGERTDFALMALARAGFGSWYVHGQLGASTVRGSSRLAAVTRRASTFLTLALERSFGPLSAVAQYQVQSPVLTSFGHRELDRSPSNLVLGLSGAVGDDWRWDASFQEDLPSDTPAIDFTLGFRLSRSW